MQSTWTQLFLHSIISIFSIMTTDLCWKRDGTAKRNSFFCLGSDWENAASCDVKIAVINNEIRMVFFFPNWQPKMKPVLSSTYFIMHAFTSPLSHSLSPLTNFLCLSSPPCHLPSPSPLPPRVQSLHCQFVALASPSVIDHGGNSTVFAGLETCVSTGRQRRSNTLITAGL